MYFDDEGPAVSREEPPLPGAEQRVAALNANPQEQSLAALEYDAAANAMAVRSLRMGQSRAAFLRSMGQYWDQAAGRFVASVAAQEAAMNRPVSNEQG